MTTTTFDLDELPPELAKAISSATTVTEVVIVSNQVPVARVVRCTPNQARIPGLHAGTIQTSDDSDARLSDEFWAGPAR